jgi:hypothetical protein
MYLIACCSRQRSSVYRAISIKSVSARLAI